MYLILEPIFTQCTCGVKKFYVTDSANISIVFKTILECFEEMFLLYIATVNANED